MRNIKKNEKVTYSSDDNFVLYIQQMVKEDEHNDVSYQEAQRGVDNLIGFFNLLLEIDRRNNVKHRRS